MDARHALDPASVADSVRAAFAPAETPASTRAMVVPLDDLPLRDHAAGQNGGVADAARDWHSERIAAITRDERAQRAEELAAARRAGYDEGLSDGRSSAEADGLAMLRDLDAKVAGALADANARTESVIQAAAGDLVEAALEIARWAIGREVGVNPEILFDVASQALADAGGVAGARVMVSPEIGRAASMWANRFGVDRPEIVEDRALPTGTVVVVSASGGKAEVSAASLIARACEVLGVQLDDEDGEG